MDLEVRVLIHAILRQALRDAVKTRSAVSGPLQAVDLLPHTIEDARVGRIDIHRGPVPEIADLIPGRAAAVVTEIPVVLGAPDNQVGLGPGMCQVEEQNVLDAIADKGPGLRTVLPAIRGAVDSPLRKARRSHLE
jgi:hypothetical protein